MVLADDQPGRYQLVFAPGPIFASLVLVDEINRATPRTQSALLEAMQERTVTVAGTTHPLPEPFLVLATQNPIEMEGTYLLPEAQRDRFLYQVLVDYPTTADLVEIARREATASAPAVSPICDATTLASVRAVVRQTLVADPVLQYAATVVQRTHAVTDGSAALVREFVQYGASPRAVQALIRTAQVEAMRAGRLQVDFADIQAVALPVLRHRLVLRREARITNISADTVIQQVLATTTAI
jgi:MoxR-like ATPase